MTQFERVFDILGTPIHIFSKSPGGVIGGKVYSPEMLKRWVGAASRPEDFYVCLNPSDTTRIKPRIEDITSFRFWLLDLDPIGTREPDTFASLLVLSNHLIAMFGYLPNHYWVDSGRGRQMWLPVLESMDTEEAQLLVKGCTDELIRRAEKDLAAIGLRIDEACAEISHLARLPGTVNTKTGQMADIAQQIGGEIQLSAGDMRQYIAPEPAQLPTVVAWNPDSGRPPSTLELLCWWNGLTPYNRAFIQNGVNTALESRHRRATATARQLRDLGCEPSVAMGWLLDGAERCQPRLDGLFINRLHRETFK